MSPLPSDVPSAARGRVLVVDDDELQLRGLARHLRAAGFHVEAALDGERAARLFGEQGAFHAIVSDIVMPGMGGLDLLRRVRERDMDVPVILLTGEPSVETAVEALDYGALRYLFKPVDPKALCETVGRAVNLYRMARAKRELLSMMGRDGRLLGDRMSLEVKLDAALERLYMVYQPIVRWSRRRVAGYEALVRTEEPSIPHPGVLFDVAERLDRVRDLSRAIRARAPLPFADRRDRGWLFLNLHVRDLLDEELFDDHAPLAAIAEHVVLEITERASLREVGDVRGKVARLREMGFRIAVDDLGAGYAGLSSFAQLEPDVVKLDLTLVRDVHRSATKQKLVRSMVTLCQEMGMEVVAEGIECVEELQCLVDLGCDLLQGFYFARPGRPFPEVANLLT